MHIYVHKDWIPLLIAIRAFVGLAYKGKDIGFRFIIEHSSLRDLGS
jgi:hypothetical protein